MEQNGIGATVGIVIIVILLVAGGIYFFTNLEAPPALPTEQPPIEIDDTL